MSYDKDDVSGVLEAYAYISKGIIYDPSTNEDRYGSMRISPSYSLRFCAGVMDPISEYAKF